MRSDSHQPIRSAISAHFAGAGAPRRERAMRAHLPSCADCRAFYERWLVVASLDPAAPSDQSRLARGLGLPVGRAPGGGLGRWLSLAGVAAAAVAILLVLVRPGPPPGVAGRDFVARGAGAPARAPELDIYRLPAGGGASEPLTGTLHAGDELAFAYRNPTGKHRVLVFAVDEHGHVFWFHPGWADPAGSPGAVTVTTAPGLHELPAAIAQRYDGQRLVVHALFTDQELTVRQVEAALAIPAEKGREEERRWPFADVTEVIHAVRVAP